MAKNASLASLIIETDSQMVADLVNNMKGNKNEIYWLISEIQDKIKDLRNVKFEHTSRSCNAIARFLAKLAFDFLKTAVWFGSFPIKIMNVFTSFE